MKQTAVEWFAEKIGHNSLMALTEYNEILEQAKAMEREQISKAYVFGSAYGIDMNNGLNPTNYYKETYESNA